jgi:hypothetical protein
MKNFRETVKQRIGAIGIDARLGILTAVTSLAVAYVRHGIETKWALWRGIENILSSWFSHFIALWILIFLSSFTAMFMSIAVLGESGFATTGGIQKMFRLRRPSRAVLGNLLIQLGRGCSGSNARAQALHPDHEASH